MRCKTGLRDSSMSHKVKGGCYTQTNLVVVSRQSVSCTYEIFSLTYVMCRIQIKQSKEFLVNFYTFSIKLCEWIHCCVCSLLSYSKSKSLGVEIYTVFVLVWTISLFLLFMLRLINFWNLQLERLGGNLNINLIGVSVKTTLLIKSK